MKIDHGLCPVLRNRLLQLGLELGRLQVVGLEPQRAAPVAVSLGEMGLADALRADEGDILARMQVCQRRKLPEHLVTGHVRVDTSKLCKRLGFRYS